MMLNAASELLQRIEQRGAIVGVIGLGYVGLLPLAVELAQEARLVVDTRNATGDLAEAPHIWRMSHPRASGPDTSQARQGAA